MHSLTNMKRIFSILALSAVLNSLPMGAQNAPIQLKINASKQIAKVSQLFNGTNIEDLNNQTNGGMFSQLLHGEAFEENVEVSDILNLKREDYSKIYLLEDERGLPHLITQIDIYHHIKWNNRDERQDVNSRDVYDAPQFKKARSLSGWNFRGRFIPYDSLPSNIQKQLLERMKGKEQISKFWDKLQKGMPNYRYELVRDGNAYMGRQTQVIRFNGGKGEVGIVNHGLYKMGIQLLSGKEYDGVLRVKAETPTTIWLSLRDEQGNVLAEKPYVLKGDGTYEKVTFELVPVATTSKGGFAISLKQQGKIELGFAFMQPGEWGRVKGYPLRKPFIEALQKQGIKVFRYNGSMVDHGADTYLYRWKKMLGPIDERKVVFRAGFNLYATHSFGFIEMLQAAEVVGAEAIIGMSMDETSEDIRDFVEYANGASDTQWGAVRTKDGHPKPYGLKYIEVHNEQEISPGYVECMKKFAQAAWKVDPEITIMTSLNIGNQGYKRGSAQYALASKMVSWFIAQGKGDKLAWDPHYSGWPGFGDNIPAFENEMGITLQRELAKDYPGFKLNLHPMEENGSTCDWGRGLMHARNWNTLQRYGDCFKMLGTANTFQPYGLHYMWNQGRIHYTSDAIWFQPSAHIDEMMMNTWKPIVVETSSSKPRTLDITAKVNDRKTEMTIYVVNLSNKPQEAVLDIDNFRFKSQVDIKTIGDCNLTEYNTYENQNNVIFKSSHIRLTRKNMKYVFPRYSYTVMTLTK